MDERRPGCLIGLLELFLVRRVYDWLQDTIGFGRGSCAGVGCGVILILLLILFTCSICAGTDWFRLW